jgi:NADPH:quinone reductase-like Zn-dependent oxidoreductase
MAELVVAGTVRVAIQRTYPLDEAAAALEDFDTGHTRGKIVISAG